MKIREFIIMPHTADTMGLIHKPGTGPNNRFGFKNVGNNKANEIDEARGTCWHGYQQKGYKKKGNKMVPNCLKKMLVEKELKQKRFTQVSMMKPKGLEVDQKKMHQLHRG